MSSEFNGSPREGLERLDPGNPLAPDDSIAHVALVYVPYLRAVTNLPLQS